MKNILVVGASSGIGAALAERLDAGGHRVLSISRENRNGREGYFRGDVLEPDSLPAIDEPLHGLVYCPGSIQLRPFKMLKDKDFRKDLEINVLGMVNVLHAYSKQLHEAGNASVVLFSTVAVQTGMPFHASVAAAKGAVEGLARSLAAEWAPGVRVNVIAPSLTDTPLAARLLDTEAKRNSSSERHPLKQVGKPEDVASLAAWLLDDISSFMTGQVLKWDGGISSLKV
jgi:3-oxoacyl-[acyl-carrier protein] reductase